MRPAATHNEPGLLPSDVTTTLACDAKTLAKMLCVSVRTIRQLDAGGKLPRPVTIGARSVRWPRSKHGWRPNVQTVQRGSL